MPAGLIVGLLRRSLLGPRFRSRRCLARHHGLQRGKPILKVPILFLLAWMALKTERIKQ
jgi:hypothetical protein